MDFQNNGFLFLNSKFIMCGKLLFEYIYGIWKESMIQRLSNLNNHNRLATEISQVYALIAILSFTTVIFVGKKVRG